MLVPFSHVRKDLYPLDADILFPVNLHWFQQITVETGQLNADSRKHRQSFLCSGAHPPARFSWFRIGDSCPQASCMCKNKKCCGARQFLSNPEIILWKKHDSSELVCISQRELRACWTMPWQSWGWIRLLMMPCPALPSSEPAASMGLHPAPAVINRSGSH